MKYNYILKGSLFMLLFMSGCKKESGFLPAYDKREPYYNDVTFEHQWSQSVSKGREGNFVIGLKRTSNMILLVSSETIHSFSLDGEPLWVYTPESNNRILGDFEIIETSDQLMFFQKGGGGHFTILDKSSGAFIERTSLRDLHGFEGTTLSVEKWNDKLYVLTYQLVSTGSAEVINRIYKLDPFSRDLTLLVSEDGFNHFHFYNPILIDSIQSKLYILFRTQDNSINFLNFIELNLLNDDYQNIRIDQLSTSSPIVTFRDTRLAKMDNIILTAFDSKTGFVAINISNNSIVWTIPQSDYQSHFHLGRLYLLDGREIKALDPMTGQQFWRTSELNFIFFDKELIFHPHKSMALIKRDFKSVLGIYDLHDGSILSKLNAVSLGNAKFFAGNSLYIESQDKVFVATDDFSIHCFKWPYK